MERAAGVLSGPELAEMIVRAVVDHPDAVRIEVIRGTMNTILDCAMADSDRGQVIGRSGGLAFAIRTLLKAVGGREKKAYVFNVLER